MSRTREGEIKAKFHAHLRAHPEVYRAFERFAREALNAGRRRVGAKAVWERMRWEMSVGDLSGRDFKLDNNLTAYYARHFLLLNPQVPTDFFSLREVRE